MLDTAIQRLKKNIRGDVHVSYVDRMPYSNDESIFSLLPTVVVAPQSEEDVRVSLEIARSYELPITCRGGGTGIAGQSIGSGMVLDFRSHYHSILGISSDHVRVQPGVVLADLNEKLAIRGRRFAPDPGSMDRCTIGGMIATNASGPHGYVHGSMRKHVSDLKVLLSDGALVESSEMFRRFESLTQLVRARQSNIESSWPKVRKNSSGYHLPALLSEGKPDYTSLLVGSEGTLAIVLEAELKTIPLPDRVTVLVLGFEDLESAIQSLPEWREQKPAAIELLDEAILEAMETAIPGALLSLGLEGKKASLWIEWEDEILGFPAAHAKIFRTWDERNHIFGLRSKASHWLHEQADRRQPLRCIEDAVVPVEHMIEYVRELRYILLKHDCDGAIFGHAGDGHLHVNPSIDVTQPRLWFRIEALMSDVCESVLRYGGSISGEHGDGVLRTNLAHRQWEFAGDLFERVKDEFDPNGLLNPGKKWVRMKAVHPPLKKFRFGG